MMSLTLTVLRKSPHPSLGTFTDVIDPRWSVPNFVSLWQEHNHADTLGFTHMLAMQGQTPEGNLRRMCYYIAHTQAPHSRHIHTLLRFPVLQAFNISSPDVARVLIRCPSRGSPLCFSSVSPGKARLICIKCPWCCCYKS